MIDSYNYQFANINQNTTTDTLLNNCNEMLTPNPTYLNNVFNQNKIEKLMVSKEKFLILAVWQCP